MTSAVTIQLDQPIEFAGEPITEITLRRATGKDLRLAMKGKNEVEDSINLASRLSGVMPAALDLLDAADLSAVLQEVGNLLQRGR